MNLFDKITTFAFALVVVFLISVVLSIPTMLLWNWLMPTLFKLTEITVLQAWGITVLAKILFSTTVQNNKE